MNSDHGVRGFGLGLPDWRGRRWRVWECLTVALGYAYLSWLPVGFMTRKGGSMGWMGWPMTSIPRAVLLSLLAFAVGWVVVRTRERAWTVVASLVGMIVCTVVAYWVYRQYVDHYAPVTDRATALQYGFEELMAGRNPYYRQTQLGQTISPMVGGLILAGPFVLTHGDMYWQGMVWFVITLAFLTWLGGARAGLVAGALLLFSPAFRLELSIQSDGWANAAALAVTGTALYLLAGRYRRSRWWTAAYVAGALVFALAFSYRFIYVVLALPLGVLLWRHYGLRAMLTAAVPAGVASLLMIFVPYFADPSVYAPFTKAGMGTTEFTVPGLPIITAVACVLVTVAGTFLMRSMAGVWGTMFAVSLVFITLTGWGQHLWYQYLTWAYNGAAIVFALFALCLPRQAPPGVAAPRSLWEDLRDRSRDQSVAARR